MPNETSISTVKICILTLLILGLFISSCKRPTEETKKTTDSKTADVPKQTADESAADKVPLVTTLPKKVYTGTPPNIRVPDLEKPRPEGETRPPFFVPVGTKNVALGKPVSSTDEAPIIGELSLITDGDKEAADGKYVELGPFLQSVTIDLQAEYNIYAILVWHYHIQARVYFDVIVQVSDDPDFITNVKTVFNNDDDNSSGLGIGKDLNYIENYEGKLIDAKGIQSRYVRLYSRGNSSNDLNDYTEVEVFGKPAK
jgi:hypothetical protein